MDESTALAELQHRLRLAVAAAPGGILPFEEFMRRALYEPGLGYYERSTRQVGRAGDFYTSVSVGSVFGELLACQFSDWLHSIDGPPCLVEVGAHDGALAGDVLTWFRSWRPEQFESLTYQIVDSSPLRRRRQLETLEPFITHVRWIEALPATNGILYSNELLDAFPVRPVRWEPACHSWREVGVAWENEQFREATFRRRPDTPEPALPEELLAILPPGFTTESSPAAEAWWARAARALGQGYLVAMDYGLTDEEFLLPQRRHGTRRGYRAHRFVDNLLSAPGDCDLTAHVNFSRIAAAGERSGLCTLELRGQASWLTGIFERTLTNPQRFAPWDSRRIRQFQTLTHPEHLGRSFRRLVQTRAIGLPPSPAITERDPAATADTLAPQ